MKTVRLIIFVVAILLSFLQTSCIAFNPEKNGLIDNTYRKITTGIRVTIDEKPRALGSNITTVELYDNSNELICNQLVKQFDFMWNSANDIVVKNGDYRLVTYYYYFGKKRLKTETNIKVSNNITNVVLKYPLFVTGKAKVKVY